MIIVKLLDLTDAVDFLTGYKCDGAYGDPETDTVYIDPRCFKWCQRLNLFHEVLELYCLKHKRMQHRDYNELAAALLDALKQLGDAHANET
jgi:hypothetical protein